MRCECSKPSFCSVFLKTLADADFDLLFCFKLQESPESEIPNCRGIEFFVARRLCFVVGKTVCIAVLHRFGQFFDRACLLRHLFLENEKAKREPRETEFSNDIRSSRLFFRFIFLHISFRRESKDTDFGLHYRNFNNADHKF